MSLARTLMNGGMYGVSIDPSKYAHDTGALRISMESTEELYEIFKEGFYEVEQAELGAIHEGVALESSQWSYVAEAAIGSAIDRIKAFLSKLWEKVKAFFHSVRRYFDSIIMSAKEFAKKYKDDIREASGKLYDFKYKMFKYTNLDKGYTKLPGDEVTAKIDESIDKLGGKTLGASAVRNIGDNDAKDKDYNEESIGDADAIAKAKKLVEDTKTKSEPDNAAKAVAEYLGIGNNADADDFDDLVFAYFRDGADGKDDTEEVAVSELTSYMNTLINSKALDTVNKMQEDSDKIFKKAKAVCDKASSKLSTAKNTGEYDKGGKGAIYSELLTAMSSVISSYQTYVNKYLTGYKEAVNERDKTYKALIMAGIKNSSKKRK